MPGCLWSSPVAAEFTATSISSERGYLRVLVDPLLWHTDVRNVDTIEVRRTPVTTTASYVVETGSSAIHAG